MKQNIKTIFWTIIVIIAVWIIGFVVYSLKKSPEPLLSLPEPEAASSTLIAEVVFSCNEGKTIEAAFYKGEEMPAEPGEMPIPSGSVEIKLSDGRSFDLPQTISADGARYATNDESFVFWNKGNGALVLEDNTEKSYIGCIVVANNPGGLPRIYSDGTTGFSIRYPENYSLNASYTYQGLGPDVEVGGVKFTIPDALGINTNLSSFDTGVSVEIIPAVWNCSTNLFLAGSNGQEISDNGVEYSFASSTQAAAGNIYEEYVWAIPETNPCVAIRYFIHSMNILNYPTGAVSEFDYQSLINEFDKIRRSLIVL